MFSLAASTRWHWVEKDEEGNGGREERIIPL
jgi:hypothetical protein